MTEQTEQLIRRIASSLETPRSVALVPDASLMRRPKRPPYVTEATRIERAQRYQESPPATSAFLRNEIHGASYQVVDAAIRAINEWVSIHEVKRADPDDLLDATQLANQIEAAETFGRAGASKRERQRLHRLERWSACYAEVEQLVHRVHRFPFRVEPDAVLAAEVTNELERIGRKFGVDGGGLDTLARIAGQRSA